MKLKAYAKINAALNVLNRREDGYHNLESVMLPIDLYDELNIDFALQDEFVCNDSSLPFDEHNTIVKALNLLKERYNIKEHFKIQVKKAIPMQAGLGGGSADGAAIIRGINELCALNLSAEEIKELCHKLGSDVIFTYYNKPALARGTGEDLTFFDLKKTYGLLLIKPPVGVSTKDAYGTLNLQACEHPDCGLLMEKLIKGENIDGYLGNSLEEPSFKLCPTIGTIKQRLKDLGLKNSLMSGSGSCVFALSEDEELLAKAAEEFKTDNFFIYNGHLLKKNEIC